MLLSDTSKLTELEIDRLHGCNGCSLNMGLPHVLQTLARRPMLTKLGLHSCFLGRDDARELRIVLCNTPSLHTLVLKQGTLVRSAVLAELAPALCRNTSIKVLDISSIHDNLYDMEFAEIFRDILRNNKGITSLDLPGHALGQTTGAFECMAEGLGSNSTLMEIRLSYCGLNDGGVSILAQTLGSRNMTLDKLTLNNNFITSTGVGALLEVMEHHSLAAELHLQGNRFETREPVSLPDLWERTRCPNLHASLLITTKSVMMGS